MINPATYFPRSWLEVGDDLAAAAEAAERVVVAPSRLAESATLPVPDRLRCFLRLEAKDADSLAEQARLAVETGLGGVILPGPCRGADVQRLDVMLSAAEAVAGRAVGEMRIVALATDHPAGVLALDSFSGKSPRLLALGGAGRRLAAALSLEDPAAEPIRQARGLLVLAAAAAGVAALADSQSGPDFEAACHRDRADGFSGKIATTADEAAVINAVFRV